MITVLTTFTLTDPITPQQAREVFLGTAPKYQGVKGLLRKTYMLSEDGSTVSGLYLWNSKPEAEALFTESWRDFVREKYRTEPGVTYFTTPVVVDNTTRQILTED